MATKNVLSDLQLYLNGLPAVYSELQGNLDSNDNESLQKMLRLAEEQVVILFWYLTLIEIYQEPDCEDSHGLVHATTLLDGEIGNSVSKLMEIYQCFSSKYSNLLRSQSTTAYMSADAFDEKAGRGRPRFIVDINHLQGLRDLGFSWTKISSLLGLSRSTVIRRRREFGLDETPTFSDISDQELDAVVDSILNICPNSGEVMVRGALLGRGIKIQRQRLRESLTRVDPVGKEMRRRYTIKRRVYNVPAPNALWHMDGNHKMIR